jgi:hypothetical protein
MFVEWQSRDGVPHADVEEEARRFQQARAASRRTGGP